MGGALRLWARGCWWAFCCSARDCEPARIVFHVNLAHSMRLLLPPMLYVGLLCIRLAARLSLHAWDGTGGMRRMVILGDGRVARELADKISCHPELRTEVVGFFQSRGPEWTSAPPGEVRGLSTLDIPANTKAEVCHRSGDRSHAAGDGGSHEPCRTLPPVGHCHQHGFAILRSLHHASPAGFDRRDSTAALRKAPRTPSAAPHQASDGSPDGDRAAGS